MNTRSWTALALVALAVVVVFFALRETHSDPENAPGRAANQETIKPIPSNPDTGRAALMTGNAVDGPPSLPARRFALARTFLRYPLTIL